MENTFDVLMEGTMVGAQIDLALMESESSKNSGEAEDAAAKVVTGIAGAKEAVASIPELQAKLDEIAKSFNPQTPSTTKVDGAESTVKKNVESAAKLAKKALDEINKFKLENDEQKKAIKEAKKAIMSQLKVLDKVKVYLMKAWETVKKIAKAVVGLEMNEANWKNVAVNVGLIVGAYSVGYGILKTLKGIAVDSFFAVKTNIKTMFKVVKDPKTYGAFKSTVLGFMFLTAFSGIARLANQVIAVIKKMFDKQGKAAKA